MARIVFNLEDGTQIESELDSDILTIGRHADSQVVLPSASVSGHHATIKRRGEDYYLQDLGTTNGTRLNGVEMEEAKLSDGDEIIFGNVPAVFSLTRPEPVVPAVAPPAPTKSSLTPPPVKADLPVPEIVRPGPPPGARIAPQGSQYRPKTHRSEGGGCAAFLLLIIFLVIAFVGGLYARHYRETKGGNLFIEIFDKYRDKVGFPKPASPDKPADAPAKPAEPAKPAPAPAETAKPAPAAPMSMDDKK